MEATNQNLDLNSVISLLRLHREVENNDYNYRETLSKIEVSDSRRELQSLHDKQLQIKGNINKNLKSIVTQKHGLQKVIEGFEFDGPKLPITHKHQQEAIDLVSNAIHFVNKCPETCKFIEPENDIDTDKLCCEITTCGESANRELNRSKIRFDQIKTFRQNTEIIRNHCFLPCDDDPDLIG